MSAHHRTFGAAGLKFRSTSLDAGEQEKVLDYLKALRDQEAHGT